MENPEKPKRPLFTGNGDKGTTRDLFGCKIPKEGILVELFVKMDFLQAAIDKLIFSNSTNPEDKEILEDVQEKLWQSYAMIQDPENKRKFTVHPIEESDLTKVENYILASKKYTPDGFIRFKTLLGQELNDCRIRAREVEIFLHRYLKSENKQIKEVVMAYFNRLSSFFFAMALRSEFGKQ
jgi:cob(I)alamin adenosyltransferase